MVFFCVKYHGKHVFLEVETKLFESCISAEMFLTFLQTNTHVPSSCRTFLGSIKLNFRTIVAEASASAVFFRNSPVSAQEVSINSSRLSCWICVAKTSLYWFRKEPVAFTVPTRYMKLMMTYHIADNISYSSDSEEGVVVVVVCVVGATIHKHINKYSISQDVQRTTAPSAGRDHEMRK